MILRGATSMKNKKSAVDISSDKYMTKEEILFYKLMNRIYNSKGKK